MSILSDSVAAEREAFIEGLCTRGFKLLNDCRTLLGAININGQPIEHEIALTAEFPITKPRVSVPNGEGSLSWHRESDGTLCLWSDDEASDLPWSDAAAMIDRISQWHAKDAAGWSNDPPDLDLERYWTSGCNPILVVHPDLEPLTGKKCRARKYLKKSFEVWDVGPGKVYKNRKRWAGVSVVNAGELKQPVRNFDELADRLGAEESEELSAAIENGDVSVVVVRYRRQEHEAAVSLIAEDQNPNRLTAVRTAHTGESTLRLRAGLDANVLANKRIALVGLGAVGSLLAEMLVRSGVGAMTLIDGDIIRPGNCIRHVATLNDVGINKAEVVKDKIITAGLISKEDANGKLTVQPQMLQDAVTTEKIFNEHDLIIDATGDNPVTALVCTASRILNRPLITVCLQRGGTVARVDRFPLLHGETHKDALPPAESHIELREGGCGDPISPAPPWACAAAAARAAGMAADLLVGRDLYPPTVIDELIKLPDSLPTASSL